MSPSEREAAAQTTPAPTGNRVSRAIRAAFSELLGAARKAESTPAPAGGMSRRMRSAYTGAETTRFNLDWRSGTNPADSEIAGASAVTRGRARDLARNNGYVERFLDLLIANVIGPNGFGHQAQVRDARGNLDERTNDYIEAKFKEWADGPVTVDGRMNLNLFSALQLETVAVDGEALTRFFVNPKHRHALGLQPIDADLLPTTITRLADGTGNEVRLGVEVDSDGKRVAYHLYERPQYTPGAKLLGPTRVSALEMEHHYRPRRAHQTRGITWFARTMTDMQDLEGYDESVILGARAGANQMAFAQWKDASMAPPPPTDDQGARLPMNIELNPATVTELDPGLEIVPFDPSQPSGVYADFTKARLRKVAAGLKVSYASLTGDLREVSYSGHKVGMLTERDLYKMLQEWWIVSFMQPVYDRWLEAAFLSGALDLPNPDWRAYRAVAWKPRRWEWTEPQREIVAVKERLALGLTSRQQVLAETSDGDFDKVVNELQQEETIARKAGVSVSGTSTTAAPPTGGPMGDGTDTADAADGSGDGVAAADGGATSRGAAPVNRLAALARNGHGKP